MKLLTFDFNNILEDVEKELIRRGHEILPHRTSEGTLARWQEADAIVVWQETELGGWKGWIEKAQAEGIPVILMQHGRRGTSRIFPPFNEKLISDALCVWGDNDVRRMVSCGVPLEKIHVTGTPVLRKVRPRRKHDGINVVFSPEHWDQDVAENLIVAGALRRIPNIKITTKLLKGEHNPREYDNPVVSDRHMPGHLDVCVETLQDADAVVAISESTFELMAEIMNIPVIIADIWQPKALAGDDRYKEYHREYSNACTKVKDLSKLGQEIMYAVNNPKYKEHERAEIGIMDGGMHIENPVDEIIKVIIAHAGNNPARNSRGDKRPHKGKGRVRRRVR